MEKKYLKTFFLGLFSSALFYIGSIYSAGCFCTSCSQYINSTCSGAPTGYCSPGYVTVAHPSLCGGSVCSSGRKYQGCAWNM